MSSQDFSYQNNASGINIDDDNDAIDDAEEYAVTSVSSVNSSATARKREVASDLFKLGLFSEMEISSTEKVTKCNSCR